MSLGVFTPAFEEVMLSTEIGSISEVFESEFGFHFLEVIDKRNYEQTNDLIRDRAYNLLYARKYEEELENTLRTMRAEAFVEFKDLD
jgi:peptidyl-prolyl cis-trans isomerase SurA